MRNREISYISKYQRVSCDKYHLAIYKGRIILCIILNRMATRALYCYLSETLNQINIVYSET